MSGLVDLRSDTVTKPSTAMRLAMADADVADDVYGEDPTVRALEARVAELLGSEAALWVPTGTMANQIALRTHLRHGDEVIIGAGAHCWRHESGALAALAGAQTQIIGVGGTFTADEVRAAYKPDDPYQAPTTVVAVENTHNNAGGMVWDRAQLAGVIAAAKQLGMALHLDGARLWNAAAAQNVAERELAAGFDTISVCLSKGLGAPAGSVVAGSRATIKAAHRFRKMYGGGLRQGAGILAAAGLYALEHNRARLADDHANARAFAEGLAGSPNLRVNLASVQTNIVMIDLVKGSAKDAIARARDAGLLLGTANSIAPGGGNAVRLRAVTHLDVDRDAVVRGAKILAEVATRL
ncbi:MAG TPA: GntG family PLP-dependent aldolase [Kofleriaceae bacterium]|jgi:threonine aldolase